jgi:hypothetical protein
MTSQETAPVDSSATQTIDGIVNEVLHLISGERGSFRNWEWFKELFLPAATFTVLTHGKNGSSVEVITVDEFIERGAPVYEKDGFLEYETGKVIDEYNGLANVFQSYVAKQGTKEERGINSYQLVFSENRWWISSVAWTSDRNGEKIPEAYLTH